VIENPFYSRKFHGEYDLVSTGRLEVAAPGDVATFVSYLARKDPDYMTGQSVMIDCGIQFS
jgi:meso-butanediol dehydrogenase/(S,S)-butanediol dehydrogenase/diacetyl reductase